MHGARWTKMKQIMGEGKDGQTNLQSRDVTNLCLHPDPPCIWPRGHKKHDNPKTIMSLADHEKAAPTVNSLACCQTDIQKNHARKTRDNFQAKHP